MRTFCICVLFYASANAWVFAQEYSRAEIFAGYSYLNADLNNLISRQSANGADFSFVANFNQWVGAETNFSGYYKSISLAQDTKASVRDFALVFGPRFHYKWAFFHGLVGLDDLGGSALDLSATNASFAGAIGGGATFKLSRYIGLEGSGDYAFSRHNLFGGSAVTQNNFRACAGIVFTFAHAGEPVALPSPGRQSATVAPVGLQIASLGLRVISATDGVQITNVAPNSLGEMAGLHVGDVINSIDGHPINGPTQLSTEISSKPAGATIRLGYMIRGEWQSEKILVLR